MWKKEELRDLNEDEKKQASKALDLIERFDSNIKIKIKDSPKINAQAHGIGSSAYIELSKRLFDKSNDSVEFNNEDIMVLVAHELGHIIPKSYYVSLVTIIVLGATILSTIMITIALWIKLPLCFTLGSIFLFFYFSRTWFVALSHNEENNADSFAVTNTKAPIPVESFASCFAKLEIALRREIELETKWEFAKRSLKKLILHIHPSVEQRIWRVRTLYGTTE